MPPFVHDILSFVGILLLGGGAAGVLAGWGCWIGKLGHVR